MIGPGVFFSLFGSRPRWWFLGVPLGWWAMLSASVSLCWATWAVICLPDYDLSVPWGVASGAVALSYAAAWVVRCRLGLWPARVFGPAYFELDLAVAQMADWPNSSETRQFCGLLRGQGIESLYTVKVGRRTLWRTVEVEVLFMAPEDGHGDALAKAMRDEVSSTSPKPSCVCITRYDHRLMCYRGAHRDLLKVARRKRVSSR